MKQTDHEKTLSEMENPALKEISADCVQGYRDGSEPDSPEPNDNRSKAYCHGFRNGRDDLNNNPTRTAQEARDAWRNIVDEALANAPTGRKE